MSWDPLWKDLCHELANGMAEIQGNPSADMKRVCNPVWTHWSYRWGAGMLSLLVVTLYVGLGFFFFFFIRGKLKKLDLKEITFCRWRSGGFLERMINGETFARLLVSPRLISPGCRAAGSQSATGTRTGVWHGAPVISITQTLHLWQQQPWTSKTSMSSAFGGAFCEGVDIFTINIFLSSSTRNGESSKCEGQCQIIIEIRIYYLLF